ncbi:hypothetical protein [Paludisphaera soli]|uniref:hypothetical protein n=1 Tax=Paludisphaera soli TaxID=2712865 RepID=UPI00197DDFD9|nr:hypothetical protein [Paludisphaera soli]
MLAALAFAWGGPVARFLAPIVIGSLYPVFVRGTTWLDYVAIVATAFVLAFLTLPPIIPSGIGRHRPRVPATTAPPFPAPVDERSSHNIRQP